MLTQLPSVPSLIPSSFATLAIGRDVSITIFTASSLNSGEKLFFGRDKTFTFPDVHPIGWTVRKARGTSDGDEDRGERDGWLGQHAELGGEDAPRPPAARDAGGQPDDQRDGRDCRGLPRDGTPDLPPGEPECFQDCQVLAPAAGGADKHM